MVEAAASEEAGMKGTSELDRISEEVVATSGTSDGGAELDAVSGSGDDVG